MTTIQKVTNFVKEVKARLTQDQNEVIVLRNQRKSDAALNSQISALENKIVDLETAVEDAEDNFNNARFPVTEIKDGKDYINQLSRTKENLDQAKGDLKNAQESLEFFQKIKSENNEIND